MEKTEIEKLVTDEVNKLYDYERDTMEIVLELRKCLTASITKKQGDDVECEFFNEDGEEIELYYTGKFIKEVATEVISGIRGQANFQGIRRGKDA